jgi:histone-lysine N-methyltransferase SETD1
VLPPHHLEGDPNCRAEIKNIGGRKRIIISALYDIEFGEELSYDYKLPLEDVKIPCNCGAANCRKFLN